MSPWALLGMTAILLLLPRVLLLAVNRAESGRPKPEIHGFRNVLWAIVAAYCAFWHRLKTNGFAPLPAHGPAILISNHTGSVDQFLLQAACRRVLGFMVAREYYNWAWLRPWCEYVGCIPVNRDGRDFSAMRTAIRALKEGRVLPIFPEGHVVPCSGRRIDELQPGTAYLAVHTQAPVIPAFICGTPETDDIFKALVTPSHARVLFGDPIDVSEFGPDRAGDKAVQSEVSARFKSALLALQARALAAEAD